jgi:hypothetical protein
LSAINPAAGAVVELVICVSRTLVIPGRRASVEPGIHNHDREYGFPDAQLRI